jgi:glutathione synthase/RimK-type ligase-like ATP-grasp enzyme
MACVMTAIGFLACETTLPGSKTRREDAFEHDNMISAIKPAFGARGWELRVIDWEAPMEAFAGLDLVMLGTSWNYQDKAQCFLAKLEELEASGIKVCNSPDVVRWNITKTYLRDLAERGARTVPTLWREKVTSRGVSEAFDVFECDRVVVKRQVGAGAEGQELVARKSLPSSDWTFGAPAMLQPFLPAIAEKGELSFLFFGGEYSHCVRKLPKSGDYRIQSLYGGTESSHEPSADEASQASAIIKALPFDAPLYARIDMLEGEDGQLMVMEAELIEPYLYPEQGPDMGETLAKAVLRELEL